MKLSAFTDHADCPNCGKNLVDELTCNVVVANGYVYCNAVCEMNDNKRYTTYFYELDQLWYVWDNQTNCYIAGTGTKHKLDAQYKAFELNSQL